MRPPNTTFDIYLGGRLPPAAPDVTGASGHLRDHWREGGEANKRDRTFFWTAVLEAPLGISIPDAYPGSPGNTTLWVPDKNGDAYTAVFVERERRSRGGDFQRVYLLKGVFLMTLTVQEVDGSPSYAGITTLLFDQADGFVVSQPAANQARVDMQAASLTQVGIVSLSAQSMGAGAKYFSDKIGIGTSSPLANSALDVRGYTYAYFAGIIAFGGGNTPGAESDGAILQYDGSAGNKNISLTIAAADYASGMAGGVLVQGTNARFLLRHRTASQPKFAFYNDDTSVYTDGQTVTELGITFTGGLRTGGSFASPLPVANGGTNSTTALNNNRIMTSQSGAIQEAGAMTNGQLLIGSAGAAPAVNALTAGSGISITNGAGSITIATSGGSGGITPHGKGTLAAAGTTQGTAAAITADSVAVTVSSATQHSVLLPSDDGARIHVYNSDPLLVLNVYPPSGAQISNLGTNNPKTLNGQQSAIFYNVSSTQWNYVMGN